MRQFQCLSDADTIGSQRLPDNISVMQTPSDPNVFLTKFIVSSSIRVLETVPHFSFCHFGSSYFSQTARCLRALSKGLGQFRIERTLVGVCETRPVVIFFRVPSSQCEVPGDGAAPPQCSIGSSLSVSSFFAVFSSSSADGDRIHGHGRSTSLRASPMTLSSPRSICSLNVPVSSVMGTSPLLGLSLVASCNVVPFPSTCSVSPIWCICLLNLWSRLLFSVPFLFELLPLPALVLCSPRGGSCKRVHVLFSSVLCFFFQSSLLPSMHSLRMLGSFSPCLRRALSACRTSCPCCLNPF